MTSKVKKLAGVATGVAITLGTGLTAFAESGPTENIVSDAINTAVSGVKSEANVVIASAIGLGVVFWGAKLLWSKFKSMAK